MWAQNIGQALVVLGIVLIVVGVAVAVAQVIIKEIRAKSAATAAGTEWDIPPELGKIIVELIKQGGGIAIAGIGVVLLLIGLEVMNDETAKAGKAALGLIGLG